MGGGSSIFRSLYSCIDDQIFTCSSALATTSFFFFLNIWPTGNWGTCLDGAGASLGSSDQLPPQSKAVANTRSGWPRLCLAKFWSHPSTEIPHLWCPVSGLYNCHSQEFLMFTPNLPSCIWWLLSLVIPSSYTREFWLHHLCALLGAAANCRC